MEKLYEMYQTDFEVFGYDPNLHIFVHQENKPRITLEWIKALYAFNFTSAGINFETLFNIPEAIDTCFWSPLTWSFNWK